MSPLKRTLTALTLAGAALSVAPIAAHAADAPEGFPGGDAVSQVIDLTDNPTETLQQAERGAVAADESVGTALAGSAPAVAGPVAAVAGASGLAG
ncbi:hypothetical protein [Streptomyces sp. NPDC097619]|uniref:hypothetical protein n=1 Tax=Streptomyces sp. NPDC097619 TaxID=3157228 RepID=UPI0033207EE9